MSMRKSVPILSDVLPVLVLAVLLVTLPRAQAADLWNVYEGAGGPGEGKEIVLVTGDEEYRSEEALTQLGRILATRHGFKCTVVFAIDPKTGVIDNNNQRNIPGLEALRTADLMIIATRFRNPPDEQMQHIDQYLRRGRPVIGMRTATHAFRSRRGWDWNHYGDGYNGEKKKWKGGFGRLVLGEKWVNHHGSHGRESTGGIAAPGAEGHPVLRGIKDGDIWGPSDVYEVNLPLPGNSQPIVLGQVLAGMKKGDKPVEGRKNNPLMPVAWSKSYQIPDGMKGQSFATTLGASTDLVEAGTRRMIVNAAYWLLGMDVPAAGTDVGLVGEFKPTRFGFKEKDYWLIKGVRPSDLM